MAPRESNYEEVIYFPPGRMRKQHHHVHFSTIQDEVHEIAAVSDMSTEEIDATWFTRNELLLMDEMIRVDLLHLLLDKPKANESARRGLGKIMSTLLILLGSASTLKVLRWPPVETADSCLLLATTL
jgi:hypothetical protein